MDGDIRIGRTGSSVAEREAKLVKKPRNAGKQDRTARGQVASRAAALEQLGAHTFFERTNRLRHAGLRQIDRLGGPADALRCRDRCEQMELANRRGRPAA